MQYLNILTKKQTHGIELLGYQEQLFASGFARMDNLPRCQSPLMSVMLTISCSGSRFASRPVFPTAIVYYPNAHKTEKSATRTARPPRRIFIIICFQLQSNLEAAQLRASAHRSLFDVNMKIFAEGEISRRPETRPPPTSRWGYPNSDF
ncbi:hypothetical protein EVAR_22083_1 [Eumeta japonica]|uniref:Uncharacterized protein n=1 Tax=Eumeta variegata TaxID=151549 RepID=A0A4C1USN0_EUMVA|nr:hypothetical protein EVAR_22083_1 [Eumeta japonica]